MPRDLDIDAIERAAKAATPGPWHRAYAYILTPEGVDVVRVCATDPYRRDENAAFLVAANPTTVLALCAEVRRLTAERDSEAKHAEMSGANVETWMDRLDNVINVLAGMPNGIPLVSPEQEVALATRVVRERDEARAEVESLRRRTETAEAHLAAAQGRLR